jgi:thermitase
MEEPDREIVLEVENAILLVDGEESEEYRGPANAEFEVTEFSERIVIHLEITGERLQTRDIIVRTAPSPHRPAPGMSGFHSYTDPETGATYDIAEWELLFGVQDGTSLKAVEALVAALDCEILREIPKINIFRIRIPANQAYERLIRLFESSGIVIFAEINSIKYPSIIPNDTYEYLEYGNGLMQLYEAWDITQGTDETIIAVVDTGTMRDHPDLTANCLVGEDFIDPIGDGEGGETPGDGAGDDSNVGHGTHCSGIVGAVGNNSEGVSGHSWNTKILPCRIFPIDGDSGAMDSDVADALVWAADQGADGISMSFGGYYGSGAEQAAINYAWAMDVVLVAAAGNSNTTYPHYPSSFPHVIAVAATNSNDKKASFSNYGVYQIDVSAPGVNVPSSIFYEHSGDPYSVPENQRYQSWSGTSMACPQVAGLVALVASYFQEYTNAQIVDQIVYTADNIDAINPGYIGELGTGRINDYKALTTPLEPDFEILSFFPDDDQPLFSQGNRDGFINPGEIIEFRPTMQNTGLAGAYQCYMYLVEDNGHIRILNDNLFLNIMYPGEIYTHPDPIIFRANPEITEDTEVMVTFRFEFTDNDPIEVPYAFTIRTDLGTVDTVDFSGEGLLEEFVPKGVTGVPGLSFTIEGDLNYATLDQLTVTQTGTAGVESLGEVQLWLDEDANGVFSTHFDTRVGYRSYDHPGWRGQFDDLNDPNAGFDTGAEYEEFGPVMFDISGEAHFYEIVVPTSPGVPRSIFVVLEILPTAITGDTVQIGILDSSDVIVLAPDQVNPINFPIQSDEVPIRGTWQDAQKLTTTTGTAQSRYSWRAETAICPVTGNVYVVFDTNRYSDFDIMMRRTTDLAFSFEEAVMIDGSAKNEFYPDIQVDSTGTIHTVYYSTKINDFNREIFYSRSVDFGVSFEDPVRLTNATRDSRIPKLAIGPDDSLNVAWNDDRTATDDYNIYFKRSDDGGDTWLTHVMVNDSYVASTEVAIAVGGDGVIHIVWEELSGQWWDPIGNVWYSRSVDDGLNFSTAVKINSGTHNNDCWHADIAADGLGNVYSVFHYVPGYKYAEISCVISNNSGSTWNPVTDLTDNNVPDSRPAIYVNPDSSLIDIAYRSLQVDSWNIWHAYSENGLSSWDDPVQISSSTWGDAREAVIVRDTNKNIYSFWEDLVNQTDYEVFYNRFLF